MTHPAYSEAEATTRETFLALMWTFSYPGRIYTLPADGADAFHAISETLLDIETSFYTSDNSLTAYLSHNGARALTPERAAYHFYPELTDAMLKTVKEASIGTLMYPDQSATLIIGARFDEEQRFTLSGPGIPPNTICEVRIGGIPEAFWQLREKANRYPRGWDVYFVDGNRLLGLPRTTMMNKEA